MKKILCLFITLLMVNSCYDVKFNEIKSIPIQETEKVNYLTRTEFGYYFNRSLSRNSVPTKIPTDIKFVLLDSKFQEVDYYFFRKFNNWFKKVKFENGIMPINQNETLDCDNFAMLYKSLMSVASYKSNHDTAPAVGLICVVQNHKFGGIPKGELHMLNIVFTNQGWFIFEPQTGEFIEINKYPNQESVYLIII